MFRKRQVLVGAIIAFALGFVLPFAAQAGTYAYVLQWGSQGSGDGQFSEPSGIAVDAGGNVYVTDWDNHRIQKFTSNGTFLTKWGSYGSGDGEFQFPCSIAVDSSGNVYVTDFENHRIQKFTSDAAFLRSWAWDCTEDLCHVPSGIAVDGYGHVYMVGFAGNTVWKFSGDGSFLNSWRFREGGPAGGFNSVAVDRSGNVYITDSVRQAVMKFTSDGTLLTEWGGWGWADGQFNSLTDVSVDASGNVYVVDLGNSRIQKFTGCGQFLTKWGSYGSGDGQFTGPWETAIDAAGNVYVTDYLLNRVQKFALGWTITASAGTRGTISPSGQVGVVEGGSWTFAITPDLGYIVADVLVDGSSVGPVETYTFTNVSADHTIAATFNLQFPVIEGPVVFRGHTYYLLDPATWEASEEKAVAMGGHLVTINDADEQNWTFNTFTYGQTVDRSLWIGFTDREVERTWVWVSGEPVTYTHWIEGEPNNINDEDYAHIVSPSYGDGLPRYFSKWNDIWNNGFGGGSEDFSPCGVVEVPTVVSAFDLTPSTLNLTSQGLWVTGFLEPPTPLSASDIDIPSIRLNGTVAVDPAAPTAIGDHDANGVPDLMVKFNRADVELILSDGDNVPVTVTGSLGSYSFTGTDYIRVRRASVSAPAAGSHLTAGSVTTVRWQTPSGVTVESVALLQSLDGGSSWDLIARGQPNSGSYDWTVPSVQTDQAKVAVVLVESSDETGYIVDGVLGVSETFAIDAPVGVGDGPVAFSLAVANPSVGPLVVSFALPTETPATLELLDVTGRRLVSRDVGSLGIGQHTVNLGEGRRLSAGLYLVRLTQGPNRRTGRVVVMQ